MKLVFHEGWDTEYRAAKGGALGQVRDTELFRAPYARGVQIAGSTLPEPQTATLTVEVWGADPEAELEALRADAQLAAEVESPYWSAPVAYLASFRPARLSGGYRVRLVWALTGSVSGLAAPGVASLAGAAAGLSAGSLHAIAPSDPGEDEQFLAVTVQRGSDDAEEDTTVAGGHVTLVRDFADDSAASGLPPGMTGQWNQSDITWSVVSGPDGSEVLQQEATASGRRAASIDAMSALTNVSAVAVMRSSDEGTSRARLYLRGGGGDGSEDAVYVSLDEEAGAEAVDVGTYANGVASTKTHVLFDWDPNTWVAVRVELEGDDIRLRVWEPNDIRDPTADEPAAWDYESTQTDVSGAGWVGVGSFTGTGTKQWSYLQVADLDSSEGGGGEPALAADDDFEGYTPGAGLPAGWTERWDAAGGAAWEVSTADGRQSLTYSSAARGRAMASLDAADDLQNVTVLGVLRTDTHSATNSNYLVQGRLYARAAGTPGNEHGLLVAFHGDDSISIEAYDNGSSVHLANPAFTWAADTWYAVRLMVDGNNLRVRVWQPADPTDPAADEPGAWLAELTQTTVTAAGWVGVGSYAEQGVRDFDLIEVVDLDAPGDSGAMRLFDGTLEMYDADVDVPQLVGLRFDGVQLPADALVTDARIRFRVGGGDAGTAGLALRIRAELQDSGTFAEADGNIANRSLTSAAVTWTPASWNELDLGTAVDTLDLSALVQEVVDAGWTPGDALTFVIDADPSDGESGASARRVAMSYDADPGDAPQLRLTYQEAPGVAPSHTRQVSASLDDAQEQVGNGNIYAGSPDVELGSDDSEGETVAGVRFRSVLAEQGDIVQQAYLRFTCHDTDGEGVIVRIRAHAADDAGPFDGGSGSNDLSGRPTTSAYVDWVIPAWTSGQRDGGTTSPNLAAVLQEVVDRAGWAPGNAVAFLITLSPEYDGPGSPPPRRSAVSYETEPSQAAELAVNTDFGSGPGDPGGGGGVQGLFTLEGDETFSVSNPTLKNGATLTGDAKTAFDGLKWLVDDFNARRYVEAGASDVDTLAGRDSLYHYGRALAQIYSDLLVALRITGWLGFLDELVRLTDIQYGALDYGYGSNPGSEAPPEPHPYLMWRESSSTPGSSYQDIDMMPSNSGRTHGIVIQIAYALEVNRGKVSPAGYNYGAKADKWKNYFQNHYRNVWMGSPTGDDWEDYYEGSWDNFFTPTSGRYRPPDGEFPFLSRHHTHSNVGMGMLNFFWGKLFPNDGNALEAGRQQLDNFADLNVFRYDGSYGSQRTWPRSLHGTGQGSFSSPDQNYHQPATYGGYVIMDFMNLWLEGAYPEMDQRLFRGLQRQLNQYAYGGSIGSNEGIGPGDIAGNTHISGPVNEQGNSMDIVSAAGWGFDSYRSVSNLMSANYGLLLPWDTPDDKAESHLAAAMASSSSYGSLSNPRVTSYNLGIIMKRMGASGWDVTAPPDSEPTGATDLHVDPSFSLSQLDNSESDATGRTQRDWYQLVLDNRTELRSWHTNGANRPAGRIGNADSTALLILLRLFGDVRLLDELAARANGMYNAMSTDSNGYLAFDPGGEYDQELDVPLTAGLVAELGWALYVNRNVSSPDGWNYEALGLQWRDWLFNHYKPRWEAFTGRSGQLPFIDKDQGHTFVNNMRTLYFMGRFGGGGGHSASDYLDAAESMLTEKLGDEYHCGIGFNGRTTKIWRHSVNGTSTNSEARQYTSYVRYEVPTYLNLMLEGFDPNERIDTTWMTRVAHSIADHVIDGDPESTGLLLASNIGGETTSSVCGVPYSDFRDRQDSQEWSLGGMHFVEGWDSRGRITSEGLFMWNDYTGGGSDNCMVPAARVFTMHYHQGRGTGKG